MAKRLKRICPDCKNTEWKHINCSCNFKGCKKCSYKGSFSVRCPRIKDHK